MRLAAFVAAAVLVAVVIDAYSGITSIGAASSTPSKLT